MRLKSLRSLREFMDFHHIESGYALAKKANILPGTVNHLLSGKRTSCSYRTARAIEGALQAPPGYLFDATMLQVADNPRQRRAA